MDGLKNIYDLFEYVLNISYSNNSIIYSNKLIYIIDNDIVFDKQYDNKIELFIQIYGYSLVTTA